MKKQGCILHRSKYPRKGGGAKCHFKVELDHSSYLWTDPYHIGSIQPLGIDLHIKLRISGNFPDFPGKNPEKWAKIALFPA